MQCTIDLNKVPMLTVPILGNRCNQARSEASLCILSRRKHVHNIISEPKYYLLQLLCIHPATPSLGGCM